MPFIVSHTSPDWDSIGATCLLMRYGGDLLPASTWPEFVNTGSPDPLVLEKAAAVVDTGRIYDPGTLRFDHHQVTNLPCATALVFGYLIERRLVPAYLEPIVSLIDDGDNGREGARQSAKIGLHAMLGAYKRLGKSDRAVLEWGCEQLDLIAASLEYKDAARRKLESCLAWQSDDGLVVAVGGGDASVTSATHELLGARLAVFVNEEALSDGGTTWAVGVQRLGGAEMTEPHVGNLVEQVLLDDWIAPEALVLPIREELGRWFRHPAGFFAGRGTRKAPNPTPPTVDAQTLAEALWAAWQRSI